MSIVGLEQHAELQNYINKIEKGKSEQDFRDIALYLRLSVEYITDQYIQENPFCVGGDLNTNIDNLKNNEIIDNQDASLFHTMRIKGNKYGAHREKNSQNLQVIDKEAVFKELVKLSDEFLSYLPFFLNKFPYPSEKPTPKVGEIEVNHEK